MPEKKINLAESHKVYLPGKEGPFYCANCEHYVAKNSCDQTEIIKLAGENKFGLSMNGEYAKVDPNGCSDYFERRHDY